MARKEFRYRGLTLEQLQELPLKEFIMLLPSRERRSIKRGFSVEEANLLRKLDKRSSVKTHQRQMVILPQMVGKTVLVHSGKGFEPIAITDEMVGHRLGQFVLTRKRVVHSGSGVTSKKEEKK